MKKITLLATISFCMLFTKLYAQVGIGTATPNAAALLHVDAGTSTTKGLLLTGTYNASATVPSLGAGTRLMFYPGKAAFRAGYVSGTQWDNAFVGLYSVAMGANSKASGAVATSIGDNTSASGDNSTAMGLYTSASALTSTAMGDHTTASGGNSTAIGTNSTASGYYSLSMGTNSTASGTNSLSMGTYTTASGNYSTSMGASVSTNNQDGAFIIGDSDPLNEGVTYSGAPDEFVARFNSGYYFMTSGDANRYGVSIGHYGNSWVSICDKNRKENFEPLNGEAVLQKLSAINFT